MSWLPGKKYFEGGICKVTRDMANQIVIITGSSSGIGLQTAKDLLLAMPLLLWPTEIKPRLNLSWKRSRKKLATKISILSL